MTRLYAGIDPGLSGAIVIIGAPGYDPMIDAMPIVRVQKSRHELDVARLRTIMDNMKHLCARVAIEKAIAMPKQGAVQRHRTAQNYGLLLGMLAMARIPYEEVYPQVWKRAMGIAANSDKGASVMKAEALFPDVELRTERGALRDGIAEALLIAEWMRRRENGIEDVPAPLVDFPKEELPF